MSNRFFLGARAHASIFITLLAAYAIGCGSAGAPVGGQGGGGGAHPTTTSSTATGKTTTSTGSGSSSSAGTGGNGGNGGAGPACAADADCKSPAATVCDKGACVPCTPSHNTCGQGSYCTDLDVCAVGCTTQSDCTGSTVCDPSSHACVGCVGDTDCPLGSVCSAPSCIPGCTPQHGCAGGKTCCTGACADLTTDAFNCAACGTSCAKAPHATPACGASKCGYTCDPAWLDCNIDAKDGCEWNWLQDGPCLCVPGTTQVCYSGAPGTQGVGTCHGGTQTCDMTGTAWGPCLGQVIPIPELCNGLDNDCDGKLAPKGCVACTAGTGSCNGTVGTYCPDGLSIIVEDCDALKGLSCTPQTGKCAGVCSVSVLGTSYLGCDYFPTITANLVDPLFSFAVAVSNTSPVSATVTASKGQNIVQTVVVAPNSVQIIKLPWDLSLKGPSGSSVQPFPASIRVNQGAYRIRSTQPVSVYQFNSLEYQIGNVFSYTNDASILLPVNAWTGTYRLAARHHFAGGSGFFAVTAKDDATVVNVTAGPSSGTVKTGVAGINANGSGTVTLNAGDVIEIVTNGGASLSDPNDVTGTLVKATKPVQVIGGHQCTNVPDSIGYCDHLEETMFPFETLSTTYLVTAPLIPTGGLMPKVEMVRIVATTNATTLTYDPPQPNAPTSIALAGQWAELPSSAADFQVTANQPILVVQYMEGQDAGGNAGDPAMTLAVAKDQYRKSYLFHAPTSYSSSYVNITAPTGTVVTLDGQLVAGFSTIGNTGFSVSRATVDNGGNGSHTISAPAAFGISVYGYGQYTSYWYPGGSELVKLHD